MSISLIALLWACGSVFSLGLSCLRNGNMTLMWAVLVCIYSWLWTLFIGIDVISENVVNPVIWRRKE